MSEFVWLDYSERERRKMLDIVDLFREHDTDVTKTSAVDLQKAQVERPTTSKPRPRSHP
jgi:hypothetical protein